PCRAHSFPYTTLFRSGVNVGGDRDPGQRHLQDEWRVAAGAEGILRTRHGLGDEDVAGPAVDQPEHDRSGLALIAPEQRVREVVRRDDAEGAADQLGADELLPELHRRGGDLLEGGVAPPPARTPDALRTVAPSLDPEAARPVGEDEPPGLEVGARGS